MIVNFKNCEISQGAYKLTRTPILIKKNFITSRALLIFCLKNGFEIKINSIYLFSYNFFFVFSDYFNLLLSIMIF